jgi:hypothetical protein
VKKVEYEFEKLFGVLLLIDDPIPSEMPTYSLRCISKFLHTRPNQLTLNVLGRRAAMSPLYKLESSVA